MGEGHQRVKPARRRADGPRRIGAGPGDHVAHSFPRRELELLIRDHTVDNKGDYNVVQCIKGGRPARVNSFPALS